ncbi:hypothetical protein [Brachybacterium sp. UNK5269]|uniref:hypothetical protein n=1 Tax=Brachybacterium sp. UNK5269 TaxID=3408576 RepID=UPI003BB1C21C
MIEEPLKSLSQPDKLREFRQAGTKPWTTVYSNWHLTDRSNGGFYAVFAEPSFRSRAASDPSWDATVGGGMPGFMVSYDSGRQVETYTRFSMPEEMQPLVIIQDFHGAIKDPLPQLSEEFRLYHNLWQSPDGTKLIKVGDDGSREDVAKISAESVEVRTSYLRKFQAGRQLDLLLFIDSVRILDAEDSVSEVECIDISWAEATETSNIDLTASPRLTGSRSPFSRLLGTKILPPPDRSHAGVWPFNEAAPEAHIEFIIGEDEDGRSILHTCDPDKLSNYFGANVGAPHYLTPVFFRRDVLQKYYSNADLYSVSDGYLTCASLWSVRIDNDSTEYVSVFLGDLGRDLPESERSHWRAHNVAPTTEISETNVRRSFLGQWADPASPEHLFKSRYRRFRNEWAVSYDWDLFRDPVEEDSHVFSRLRIPLNEQQSEFDEQILNLALVLVDSINSRQIAALLPKDSEETQSIARLTAWIAATGHPDARGVTAILVKIQRIRSKSSAHKKPSNYDTFIATELGDASYSDGFAAMLTSAIDLLDSLTELFLNIENGDDQVTNTASEGAQQET